MKASLSEAFEPSRGAWTLLPPSATAMRAVRTVRDLWPHACPRSGIAPRKPVADDGRSRSAWGQLY